MIDLPAHGLKCGEYGDLPKAVAGAYIKAGHFDPKAVQNFSGAVTTPADTGGVGANDADGGGAGDSDVGASATGGAGGEDGVADDAGSAQAGSEA